MFSLQCICKVTVCSTFRYSEGEHKVKSLHPFYLSSSPKGSMQPSLYRLNAGKNKVAKRPEDQKNRLSSYNKAVRVDIQYLLLFHSPSQAGWRDYADEPLYCVRLRNIVLYAWHSLNSFVYPWMPPAMNCLGGINTLTKLFSRFSKWFWQAKPLLVNGRMCCHSPSSLWKLWSFIYDAYKK